MHWEFPLQCRYFFCLFWSLRCFVQSFFPPQFHWQQVFSNAATFYQLSMQHASYSSCYGSFLKKYSLRTQVPQPWMLQTRKPQNIPFYLHNRYCPATVFLTLREAIFFNCVIWMSPSGKIKCQKSMISFNFKTLPMRGCRQRKPSWGMR